MLNIQENISLLPYNTFGIAASARYFVTVASVRDIQELISSSLFKKSKRLILGGGSNILLTGDFDGLVIKNDLKGIEKVVEDDEKVTLKIGAGENWHALVMNCVANDYGGLENLSLIPGTVGAAPMQNIGAYGVEIKEIINTVEAVDLASGEIRTYTKTECQFGYRESIFKQTLKDKCFISSITLTLTKKNHRFNTSYGAITDVLNQQGVKALSVKAISDAVIHIRQHKLPDPSVIGNAGSFFKNPSIQHDLHDFLKQQHPSLPSFPGENGLVKIPAAWLIEQCGWKGKTFNNIGVHKLQALVLVNYGGGTGEKIWQLAMDIQASVREKFDITLQPEVNIIR
ncbi:MAG: UDP-N-acetylmuramate dehydrogenase [Bacteroidota bacterium]